MGVTVMSRDDWEGLALVREAFAGGRVGAYTVQAAIAAVHAQARTSAETDWPEIRGLYDVLVRIDPSPVVELNRAVAVAMHDGPATALPLVDGLLAGPLANHRLAHAARADLCRRVGRLPDAAAACRRALSLTETDPERRHLERGLAGLDPPG